MRDREESESERGVIVQYLELNGWRQTERGLSEEFSVMSGATRVKYREGPNL